MKSFRNTRTFEAALLALLFALTMWSVVPVGYMADVDQDGFKVVLCDSTHPGKTLIIGADGQPVDDHEPAERDAGCVMGRSLADTALATPPPAVSGNSAGPVRGAVLPAPALVLYHNPQSSPPPARGPPVLV